MVLVVFFCSSGTNELMLRSRNLTLLADVCLSELTSDVNVTWPGYEVDPCCDGRSLLLLTVVDWKTATACKHIRGGPKKWYIFVRLITSSNIDQFSNFFHCQNQEKICNSTTTKDPTTPQVCRYTTLWNVSVLKPTTENTTTSVITHFKSASSSSKAGTLSICCKYCTMWQVLYTVTETINTLFPVVNFLKCVVKEVLFSIVYFWTLTFHKVV